MSEIKTYCLGRYLVDLPKDAEIHGQRYEYMYGLIESKKNGMDEKGFAVLMTKREAELKAVNENKGRALKDIFTPISIAKIFVTSQKIYGENDYGFEAYKLNHGHLFSLKQKNYSEDVIRNKVLTRLQKDLLPNLRIRQSEEIPSDPGFCIKDGFIADDGSQRQFEDAGMSFKFARWPDLVITVSTRTVSKSGEATLLQRMNSNPLPALFAAVAGQIRTLRKGVHDVQGRKGEEVLALLPTSAGTRQHSFRWEAAGTVGTPLMPDLTVEYESGTRFQGKPRPPTLSDDQAMELFDSIVNSIRLRPTGPARMSAAEPTPLLPLGTTTLSENVCPQSGWWHCLDAIHHSWVSVDGGRKHFFKVGQVMPQAFLAGQPSLWQKLIEGKRPFYHRAEVSKWKLVAYDEATTQSLVAAKSDVNKKSEG